MTTLTTELPAGDHDEVDHGHPSDAMYWKVGGFLGALTALEVSTYWWPEDWRKGAAVALIVMMVIKFATVAAYFMHLKYDHNIMRSFIIGPLILAILIILALMALFSAYVLLPRP